MYWTYADPDKCAVISNMLAWIEIHDGKLCHGNYDARFLHCLAWVGFGALFMLAFSGAIVEVYRLSAPGAPAQMSARGQQLLGFYLAAMVILAWLTVLSGTYQIYPWYRAVPPAGVTDLAEYPR